MGDAAYVEYHEFNLILMNGYFLLHLPTKDCWALTGMAQFVECHPAKRKVSIPVRVHAWVVGLVPRWAFARQLIDVSLTHWRCLSPAPLSLPPSSSL